MTNIEDAPLGMQRVHELLHDGNALVMIVPGEDKERRVYMAIDESSEENVALAMSALMQTLGNLTGCIVMLLDPEKERVVKIHQPRKDKVHIVNENGEKKACDHD